MKGQYNLTLLHLQTQRISYPNRKSQYEKYFKRWGLRKNHSLTSTEGKFIGRRIDKRKREHQKESEVYVDGVQYPPSKLKKSRYNKTFVSTVDNLPNGLFSLFPYHPAHMNPRELIES